MNETSDRRPLTLLLASPRGFCAGVDRAIRIVELAIEKFGAPIYVRHEIVHNRTVVERLQRKGAIFIEELSEAPPDARVIFSAHGVPKSVPEEAQRRNLFYLDATCPLVSKVHVEAERHHRAGRKVLLIGHSGHPEVIGTMGQLPEGSVALIETADQAEKFAAPATDKLAYITQTTLSVDDTAEIISVLRRRFPDIAGPHKEDICYATTNRQAAVKQIAGQCDLVLVVGAPNSSNSMRLVEVAEKAGCRSGYLIQRASEIPWNVLPSSGGTIGITAGASAPEVLVEEIISALKERYETSVDVVTTTEENVAFNIPRALRDTAPVT
jgi:4-hydroxy-3-methylbut-2-enyl diphosphate reductase